MSDNIQEKSAETTVEQPEQASEQVSKTERKEARKRKRAKRSSTVNRFMTMVIIGIIILVIVHIMNNFDSIVGRSPVVIHDKYIYEEDKGYALVGIDGATYWVSKEDWVSCALGDEVKIYTNGAGSSFIEEEDENILRQLFE